MRTVVAVFVNVLAIPPAVGAGVRVDLNMDTARADVRAPGWENWRVPDGRSATPMAWIAAMTFAKRFSSK